MAPKSPPLHKVKRLLFIKREPADSRGLFCFAVPEIHNKMDKGQWQIDKIKLQAAHPSKERTPPAIRRASDDS